MNDVAICLFASAGFDKAAQGLAGAGRRLADELDGRSRAVVIGAGADTLALEVARLCDTVIVADQAELAEYQPETCLSALARLCADLSPRAVLLAGDTYSQEIAPRLAYRLGGSAVEGIGEAALAVVIPAHAVLRRVHIPRAVAASVPLRTQA